jgi:hypothetical protein
MLVFFLNLVNYFIWIIYGCPIVNQIPISKIFLKPHNDSYKIFKPIEW